MNDYYAGTPVELPVWARTDLDIQAINDMTAETFESLSYTERCAVLRINPEKYNELAHGAKPKAQNDDMPTFTKAVDSAFERIHIDGNSE